MKVYVLFASDFDMELMRRLLDHEVRSIDLCFDSVSPMSTLYSVATTRLVVLGQPVAIVLNAGTTDPDGVMSRRQSVEEVIGVDAGRASFALLLAVPSLESLLFTSPALLTRAFGDRADDGGRSQELGRLSPRDAYKRLDPDGIAGAAASKLLQALDDDDIAALRQESPICDLIAFVTEVGSPMATASSVP